ncbi:MAG: HD domain-containing protein [Firmicutes bacterium]|nr:HD domain-containing protein [Bacillota bacterium]
MSIFEKIAEDPKILEIYEKIEKKQKKEQETCHHGWSHISSVIDKTAFFMQLAGADEIQIEEAKIAALLHDTGLLVSEKNHAEHSYEFAKDYLKKKKIELKDRKEVLQAIRVHSNGFDSDSLMALCLILADKLDHGPQRLTEDGLKTRGIRQMQHVIRIEYPVLDSGFSHGCFVVNLITDGQMDLGELCEWKFVRKIFCAVRAYGRKLHRYPILQIDGKKWDLYRDILKIALLQIQPERLPAGSTDDALFLEAQRQKGIAACRKAKEMGADIALFPEMFSCGYQMPKDEDRFVKLSLSRDSEFVETFAQLAAELDMAIAITFLEAWDPAPRNSVALFDRHGSLQYVYAKVHTCDFSDERRLTQGEEFPVVSLDTRLGPVKVGSMICYDREFPETARILMLEGAELLLVPNACPMEINRLSQLRGRAYENMIAIATCNYPGTHPDCNGHSSVFDGAMFIPDAPEPLDACLVEGGEEEEILMAKLDLTKLRDYRTYEIHGNAYRRPRLYQALISEEVTEPFVRDLARH